MDSKIAASFAKGKADATTSENKMKRYNSMWLTAVMHCYWRPARAWQTIMESPVFRISGIS
jgi:hypothetical protein